MAVRHPPKPNRIPHGDPAIGGMERNLYEESNGVPFTTQPHLSFPVATAHVLEQGSADSLTLIVTIQVTGNPLTRDVLASHQSQLGSPAPRGFLPYGKTPIQSQNPSNVGRRVRKVPVQRVSQAHDRGLLEAGQRKQVPVAGHDDVRLRRRGAFANAIVRFVVKDVDVDPRLENGRGPCDAGEQSLEPVGGSGKLVAQGVRGLGEDGDGGEQLEPAIDGKEVRLLGLAARTAERGDEDGGVKDDPHGQRPVNTRASTSSSVSTPLLLAWRAP